jgi:hypothetical protein
MEKVRTPVRVHQSAIVRRTLDSDKAQNYAEGARTHQNSKIVEKSKNHQKPNSSIYLRRSASQRPKVESILWETKTPNFRKKRHLQKSAITVILSKDQCPDASASGSSNRPDPTLESLGCKFRDARQSAEFAFKTNPGGVYSAKSVDLKSHRLPSVNMAKDYVIENRLYPQKFTAKNLRQNNMERFMVNNRLKGVENQNADGNMEKETQNSSHNPLAKFIKQGLTNKDTNILKQIKQFRKLKKRSNAFYKVLNKKRKRKKMWKIRNPDYQKLKTKIYKQSVTNLIKPTEYFTKMDKIYKKKLGLAKYQEMMKLKQRVQKATFEAHRRTLQNIFGAQNNFIKKSKKFFKGESLEEYIKEYKYLLESTKVKELKNFDHYLQEKAALESYKEGMKSLDKMLDDCNNITGLEAAFENIFIDEERDIHVWDLEPDALQKFLEAEKLKDYAPEEKKMASYHDL